MTLSSIKKFFVACCCILCLQCNTTIDSSSSKPISESVPYPSKYIEVLGSKMHYVDEGKGRVFLFLHGNPMSLYYWRNIMPYLESQGRVIALDLMGMGKSDKPDLDYSFLDHARYVEAFIQKMNLKNITIIGHDWGSGLELYYATRHQNNVKGLVFMEAVLGEEQWSDYTPEKRNLLQFLRTEEGKQTIIQNNTIVNPGIQDDVLRPLRKRELAAYETPFRSPESRYLTWKWVTEIPIEGQPVEMSAVVQQYMSILEKWEVPKLLLYATPGEVYTPEEAIRIGNSLPNCTTLPVGEGLHYLAEDQPHAIGIAIKNWCLTQN